MAKKNRSKKVKIRRPKALARVMSRKGVAKRALNLAGSSVLRIEYHSFNFRESNGRSWKSKSKLVTPPPGWKRVAISVSEHELGFGAQNYEDHNLGYIGVDAGVAMVSNKVRVTARAILRDDNGDDRWRGRVAIQLIYTG